MYLRYSKAKSKGKTHTYWRLVRSVRTGSRVGQETVAWLGELDAAARVKASGLARHFLGATDEQLSLFEDPTPVDTARVKLRDVRVERGRSFGDVWLAWTLWRALKLDEFSERVLPRGREKVSRDDIASIPVIARFCEPSSELHIAEDWYRRTALEDLLGISPDAVHHRRLYQGLDRRLSSLKKPADRVQVERQIGRLLGRNSRAAGGFKITVTEDSTRGSGFRATWKRVSEWSEWARLTEGTYILRSNRRRRPPSRGRARAEAALCGPARRGPGSPTGSARLGAASGPPATPHRWQM